MWQNVCLSEQIRPEDTLVAWMLSKKQQQIPFRWWCPSLCNVWMCGLVHLSNIAQPSPVSLFHLLYDVVDTCASADFFKIVPGGF